MTLTPISDADWPDDLAALKDGFLGKTNIYRTLANHPGLLAAWPQLREHIVNRNALGRERLEVVTLRTAHRMGSDYEWTHHILRGRDGGLSDARIRSLAGPAEMMEPDDALLARMVDALCDNARLPGPLRDTAIAQLGAPAVLDLMATVGFYSTLAFAANSFEIAIDESVADGVAANPLD